MIILPYAVSHSTAGSEDSWKQLCWLWEWDCRIPDAIHCNVQPGGWKKIWINFDFRGSYLYMYNNSR